MTRLRILVTGQEGQVARSLAERNGERHALAFAARPGFDLADEDSILRSFDSVRPDFVISAAAYTAVDQAEDEPDVAMKVNRDGPAVLAKAAQRHGVPILHLSTDYVFAGDLDRPYVESDPVGPIGVYGKTKLAGEEAVRASGAAHAIIRTAWVYSPFGNNFVKTMLRLAATRDTLNVVEDQHGCPTSALDIADGLFAAIETWSAEKSGTYHLAGTGETNWADFARAIFVESASGGGPSATVEGIASHAYPTRATRPSNSRLNSDLFAETFGYRAPHWQDSVRMVTRRLRDQSR